MPTGRRRPARLPASLRSTVRHRPRHRQGCHNSRTCFDLGLRSPPPIMACSRAVMLRMVCLAFARLLGLLLLFSRSQRAEGVELPALHHEVAVLSRRLGSRPRLSWPDQPYSPPSPGTSPPRCAAPGRSPPAPLLSCHRRLVCWKRRAKPATTGRQLTWLSGNSVRKGSSSLPRTGPSSLPSWSAPAWPVTAPAAAGASRDHSAMAPRSDQAASRQAESAQTARPRPDRAFYTATHPADGAREQHPGLPAHPRRTRHARNPDRPLHQYQHGA